jgi:predicted DNA-binding transcriptional regulator YafY
VQQRQPVFLRYRAWGGEETERDFDPYGIVFHEGYWYSSGYCHLRRDLRSFRLDRILTLEARSGRFERPADFDVLRHVLGSIATMPGAHQVEVLMQTTMERARQVISPEAGTLEERDTGVIFRRQSYELEWIAYFLIHMDFPVYVRQPTELRDLVRRFAERALHMLDEET